MKILMVCLGNICRSPLAEGIAKNLIAMRNLPWDVDSAGTIDWHEGNSPDARSIACARKFGIDISGQISRKIRKTDLIEYDIILAMDAQNFQDVQSMDGELARDKLYMIMNFLHPGRNLPVPDPYYGGEDDFDQVAAMLEDACNAMLDHLEARKLS
ncbi:MAG: low molecular weight phosphotyrosine protein phosphatase [Saprospiraceae bacterium]|nr:low molecular weight phosphotyrosine protein phosphatase [Saprospiraceae bacterium]